MALNVIGKYSDDLWMQVDTKKGAWNNAYYGIVKPFGHCGFKVGKGGADMNNSGIYCTPDFREAWP